MKARRAFFQKVTIAVEDIIVGDDNAAEVFVPAGEPLLA
jgi:hypothetical protein